MFANEVVLMNFVAERSRNYPPLKTKIMPETTQNQESHKLHQHTVSSSVSIPAVRIRFHPKDTDETYDGTLIEENQHSYLVVPDDNLTGTARWNKKCCELLTK